MTRHDAKAIWFESHHRRLERQAMVYQQLLRLPWLNFKPDKVRRALERKNLDTGLPEGFLSFVKRLLDAHMMLYGKHWIGSCLRSGEDMPWMRDDIMDHIIDTAVFHFEDCLTNMDEAPRRIIEDALLAAKRVKSRRVFPPSDVWAEHESAA